MTITEQDLNTAIDEVMTMGPGTDHPEYKAAFKLTADNPWLWNGFTETVITESTLAAAMQMGLLLGMALVRNGVQYIADPWSDAAAAAEAAPPPCGDHAEAVGGIGLYCDQPAGHPLPHSMSQGEGLPPVTWRSLTAEARA